VGIEMKVMKLGVTKTAVVGCILIVVFFMFCVSHYSLNQYERRS